MSDIAEEINKCVLTRPDYSNGAWWKIKARQAADEIEKLRAENDELKRLLKTQKGISETMLKHWRQLVSEHHELKAANEWQPIDSAPKDEEILTYALHYGIIVEENCDRDSVSHWQPLPSPPK